MALPYPFVQQVLKQSGYKGGVEYRLFLSRDVDLAELKAHMCWLKLPEGTARPIPQQHHRLKDRPWFAGILTGDKDNHIGVRVWGGPVLPEVRLEIAHCLGISAPPQVTTARRGPAGSPKRSHQSFWRRSQGDEHLPPSEIRDGSPRPRCGAHESASRLGGFQNACRRHTASRQRVVRATVRQQYRTMGRNAVLPAVTGCPKPEDTMAVDVEAGDSADADLL